MNIKKLGVKKMTQVRKVVKKAVRTRVKKPANLINLNSVEDTQVAIKKMGDIQREYLRMSTKMNDEIALVTENYAGDLEDLKAQVEQLQTGIQAFCESRRTDLTNNGKIKTVKFTTGEVSWRQRPPSVSIRGVDGVLEMLERMGLNKFIREKQEINKDAILNEPDEVKGIAGINVRTGIEDFIVKPFENKAQT